MAANESTDRLHVADRLPLEYPPREIARIYGARLGLLLLTLALLAVVMLLLYFLAAAIRDRDATPFVAALTGALIGWLGRPEVRAQLRARVRGIINPARFDPPTDRAPGHRAHQATGSESVMPAPPADFSPTQARTTQSAFHNPR